MTGSYDQPTRITLNSRARGAETRARLLNAAAELVAENGWDNVTTRQIARRAGVNQGLLHYHFETRERLLQAAFEAAVRETFSAPGAALVEGASLASTAAALVRGMRPTDESEPIALFSMEAIVRAARDAGVRQPMADVLTEFRRLVADRIESGQARGELSPRLDPVGTATVLGALFDGLGMHLLIDGSIDVERTAYAVAGLLSAQSGEAPFSSNR